MSSIPQFEAFQAVADAQTKWLSAVGDYCLKQAQAKQAEAHTEIDKIRQRILRQAATQYQQEYQRMLAQRYILEAVASRRLKKARDLFQLLQPGISRPTQLAGWAAMSMFIGLYGWEMADTIAGCGPRLQELMRESTLPALGSEDWQMIAQVIGALAENCSHEATIIQENLSELEAGYYATWSPLEILKAIVSSEAT